MSRSIPKGRAAIVSDPSFREATGIYEAWLRSRATFEEMPALSVGVVHDQELIWSRSFGFEDAARTRPAGDRTLYRIASISKTFTSLAVVRMRDAGLLSLDDPVARHLSWFRLDAPPEEEGALTIRHLLTHTAGLPREAAFPYWVDARFPSIGEVLETIREQSPVYAWDTEWKYSNLGFIVLGEIVAALDERGFERYVQDEILDPLGLAHTWVHPDGAGAPGLAQGFGRRLPGAERVLAPYSETCAVTAAAGMASCVEDLARYVSFHLSAYPTPGPRLEPEHASRPNREPTTSVLAHRSLREMHRVHWLHPDWLGGWGLGFSVVRVNGRTRVGHGGALRGYRTQIDFCPEEKFGVVALTSAEDGRPADLVEQAYQIVAPVVREIVRPSSPRSQPDPAWDRCLGAYRSAWGDVAVIQGARGLVVIDPNAPMPLLGRVDLVPLGDGRFRIDSDSGFVSRGEIASFDTAAPGPATRLHMGAVWLDRIEP